MILRFVLLSLVVACTTTPSHPDPSTYGRKITRLTLIDEGCPSQKCPNFEITFQRSGIATYHGHKNVDQIGRVSGRIEKADWLELAAWTGKYRLDRIKSHYLGADTRKGKKVLKIYKGRKVRRILVGNGKKVPKKIQFVIDLMKTKSEDIEWSDL